jgi:uncharacterized delta-60 repeat protein
MRHARRRRPIALTLVMAVGASLVVLSASPAAASPGEPDPSFGGDGVIDVDFGISGQQFRSGAPDGSKVVAVGRAGDDFSVARLRARGALDGGFGGGDGRRTIDFGYRDEAYGVAVHEDGRISVVGSADDAQGEPRLAVARLTRGGGLDTSFSGDGRVTTRSPDGYGLYGSDAVIQPDGKLVVSGETYDAGAGRMIVVRFNRNGRLDRTFGGDGKVLIDATPQADGAWRVALTSTGGIVVAGWSGDNDEARTVVARLLPNGRRDRSFSGDGVRVMDLSPGQTDYALGLALTGDDHILLGVNLYANGFDPHVVKLKPGGAFDSRFGGGDGMASNLADGYQMVDIDVRSDGKIVAAIRATNIGSFMVNRKGMPVGAYGNGGFAFTDTPMTGEAMYVDAVDRPVITGLNAGLPRVVRLQP